MSKNKRNLKVFKLATAGLALTAVASPVYTQVLPTSQVAYAATVSDGADLVNALRNAKAGEVITLAKGFTLTPDQIGNNSTFTIPAGVTIDGATHTLTVRGIDIKTQDGVTLKNLNYTIVKDTSTEGSITSLTGTLTLENVTTIISATQSATRPLLVADGGNITVKGGGDQTVFDKIVAKKPSNIILETNNIRSTNGVELVSGATVNTSSNFVSKFSGPGSVVFSKSIISDVELSNVANIATVDGANVQLKNGLQGFGDQAVITNKITVEQGSTLNANNNWLTIKELAGTGNYNMQHDGKLTVDTITQATNIEIQKNDINYADHKGKVYVQATNVTAEPVITIQNNPTQYKIKRAAGDFVLEKSEEVDKSYLKDELDIANADTENKIPTATPETKSKFEEALKKAQEVYNNPTATQPEINAAETALKDAYEGLVKDTNPTPAPTTVAPTTEAPTTAAPTTVAPTTEAPTTAAPTTVAPTTEAPTTAAPTTVAPTTEAPTTAAPTTVAPTTEAPTTAAPVVTATVLPLIEPEKSAGVINNTTSIVVSENVITKILTEIPSTRIVTDTPVTRVVTDVPRTQVVSNEETTKIITEAPATKIVTDAPVTRVVTDVPSTKVVTEVVPVTQIVTQKVEPVVQNPQPKLEVSIMQNTVKNTVQSGSQSLVTVEKTTFTANATEQKVLPKTSAVKENTTNTSIVGSIAAVLSILAIRFGLKKRNK